MRILIANRGEIARRVIRTAHRLGHSTVAVYADPDADAPFVGDATMSVHLGPAPLAASYLSVERILAAAAQTDTDAVHPGYGFLSENAAFAQAVTDAGLIWIGPSPAAITQMGSKIEARRLAAAAGVAVIPGYDESQDPTALTVAAERIGYPILAKAAAGGGGKGIRIAHTADQFDAALSEARAEAERFFGDGAMIVERFIQRPRHVEVQVVGDKHANVIDLGTRECSVQRRYQKLLEEAPAPNLPEATRAGLRSAATALAASIGYDSTGTVEFIVDDAAIDTNPNAYFFLEMNTRLQVEHPVTEMVTGLDLVELQINIAQGEPLPITQDDVTLSGHAFEARVNAEDATNDFAPQVGTITHLHVPSNARWDSGIEVGSTITPHYDPMVAKLVVHDVNRATALDRLRDALDQLLVGGLVTNTGFHRWLADQPDVVAGRVTTRFLDETKLADQSDNEARAAQLAAAAWSAARETPNANSPWAVRTGMRLTPHVPRRHIALVDLADNVHEPTVLAVGTDPIAAPTHVDLAERQVVVNVAGQSHSYRVLTRSEHWAPDEGTGHGSAGAVTATFPAVVAEVAVSPGDQVAPGDAVVVIEAMKMLHTLVASGPGVVAQVHVGAGDTVASGQVLVTFEADTPSLEADQP